MRAVTVSPNSVLAVEVVTADGRAVRVDSDSEPDLFWAVRGGGGSFAIVTALEFALYPVAEVYAGAMFWPMERAGKVLQTWRELVADAPRALTSLGRLLQFPPIPDVPEPFRGRAFAVRRGEGDRDSLRVARWAVREGHVLAVFAEGTRQQLGQLGPMHAGAAMIAIQEEVPIVPCGIDTFGWSIKNRRSCCLVWGEPVRLDFPRTGKGYKEGTAVIGELISGLWRTAVQASADGFPPVLPNGLHRARPIRARDALSYPELATWPDEDWAVRPLGPVYRPRRIQPAA